MRWNNNRTIWQPLVLTKHFWRFTILHVKSVKSENWLLYCYIMPNVTKLVTNLQIIKRNSKPSSAYTPLGKRIPESHKKIGFRQPWRQGFLFNNVLIYLPKTNGFWNIFRGTICEKVNILHYAYYTIHSMKAWCGTLVAEE